MAKQTVNLGTSANKGDGDPLRTAFDKVNDNFTELYPRVEALEDGNVTTDVVGSIFGDDSTLLVDGVNNLIPASVISGTLSNNTTGNADTATTVAWTGVTSTPTTLAGYGITDAIAPGTVHDGDITGSVFGDDSTVLVDGVNNKIVGAVDTASLTVSSTNVAIGNSAGETTQGVQAVSLGARAGQTTQGIRSVAVGADAGNSSQGEDAVAVGYTAGRNDQGANAIAIGRLAGETNQAANSIVLNATGAAVQNTTASSLVIKPIRDAVGTTMLMYDVTSGEVTHTASPAITGDFTGSVFGDDSTLLVDGNNNKIVGAVDTTSLRTSETKIALGNSAGNTTQGNNAVAVGNLAGQTTQGGSAVAIGYFAGLSGQGQFGIAIGNTAGQTTQSTSAVAIGQSAGNATQGQGAVAVGTQAGLTTQGTKAIAIGYRAGETSQAANSIVLNATGLVLNNTTASSLRIKPIRSAVGTTMLMYDATSGEVTHTASPAITGDFTGSVFGDDSTLLVDGVNNKIVGAVDTASLRTSESKIALGYNAGSDTQSGYAVAIGSGAGKTNQGTKAVAIGQEAGKTTQGTNAIAIGHYAGNTTQGANSIAIGSAAGTTSQGANSIVINATVTAVENTTASSLRIKPIRNATMTTILGYDAGTGEVTHNAAIPGYISLADLKTEVAASADFAAFKGRIAAL